MAGNRSLAFTGVSPGSCSTTDHERADGALPEGTEGDAPSLSVSSGPASVMSTAGRGRVRVIQVLPALPAWPEVQVGDLLRYLAPDLHNHVALLPHVDICRALREPVAEVHAALPGDPHLEGAVRDEHPERVPRQRLHQARGDTPTGNSIFEPSRALSGVEGRGGMPPRIPTALPRPPR